MADVYGALLARVLFPLFEALRGRPTVELLSTLRQTELWPLDALRDLQVGLLRRVLRHAYDHTEHYRELFDAHGFRPDVRDVGELARLPLLDRDTVRRTLATRTAKAPPFAEITKSTSGTTGEPVVVKYNAESRHWRDATRWRGYGWGGYRIGMRAMHYWGRAPAPEARMRRWKQSLDHAMKRDLYVDCIPRSKQALSAAVAQIRRFRPHVIVAYASGAASLARFVLDQGLRDWQHIPVIVGAERLWDHDRAVIEEAFGTAFETYGCREVMLVGAECEYHDGLHIAMEHVLVEVVVREPNGTVRAARPGETGEVAITDLHNLACPMIRYVTGDLAVARAVEPCRCGRSLVRIGPVEGRVTATLRDGDGNAVGGLVFNILFGVLHDVAREFQVVQKPDGRVVMRVIPSRGTHLPETATRAIHDFAKRYLPGIAFAIDHVDQIPLTAAGKRNVVIVER